MTFTNDEKEDINLMYSQAMNLYTQHTVAMNYYKRLNNWIQIPLIATTSLAAAVSTLTFTIPSISLKITSCIISSISASLQGVSTFYNLLQKVSNHQKAAKDCLEIAHFIRDEWSLNGSRNSKFITLKNDGKFIESKEDYLYYLFNTVEQMEDRIQEMVPAFILEMDIDDEYTLICK